MYYGRFSKRALAKTVLAYALVIGIGYMIGMYVTYQDMVTVNEVGTVAMYAMLGFIVRKMMS